jgi:DNA polymerase I
MKTQVWLGIDGTNWIHQLWHAMANSRPGQVVDAAMRRHAAIVEWIESDQRKTPMDCSRSIVCFDRRSFRADLTSTYKANRGPKLTGLVDTLSMAEGMFAKHETVAAVDGYEADDLLATYAQYAVTAGANAILASPDKDLRQCLVQHRVSILASCIIDRGSLTRPDFWTAERLQNDVGLQPNQWSDYQALCGERGDNVDGCPGIGPVTAVKMLQKCGTLKNILANPWSAPCTTKQRDSLFAWKDRVDLALQLVTLRTDVHELWDYVR